MQLHLFDGMHISDFALSIDKASRFMSYLANKHREGVKCIFKYMKSMKNYDILCDDLMNNVKFG